MADINNQQILKEMRDTAKVQNFQSVPSQLAEKVVPTLEINHEMFRTVTEIYENNDAGILTTLKDKVFCITGISLGVKCTNTLTHLEVTGVLLNGYTHNLMNVCFQKLATAEVVNQNIMFHQPIELLPSTDINVLVDSTFAVLNISVFGYYKE
jgi:hypothetical protein